MELRIPCEITDLAFNRPWNHGSRARSHIGFRIGSPYAPGPREPAPGDRIAYEIQVPHVTHDPVREPG